MTTLLKLAHCTMGTESCQRGKSLSTVRLCLYAHSLASNAYFVRGYFNCNTCAIIAKRPDQTLSTDSKGSQTVHSQEAPLLLMYQWFKLLAV